MGSPARRAPLRGERHWRGATAAQKHRDMMCAQYLQNIMIEYLIVISHVPFLSPIVLFGGGTTFH